MMCPAGESRHHKVLVVEDLDHECEAIKTAIEEVMPSCRFVEAKSVTQAQTFIEKEESLFDLVVLDLKLGEGLQDGWALLGSNQASRLRHTPVIIYTAVSNVELPQGVYELGAIVYIRKLDEDSTQLLQKAVREILQGKARTAAPSERLGQGIERPQKQLEEALYKAVKPLQEQLDEMWTHEEVQIAVKVAVEPREKVIRVLQLGYVVLMIELIIATLYLLWKAVL